MNKVIIRQIMMIENGVVQCFWLQDIKQKQRITKVQKKSSN